MRKRERDKCKKNFWDRLMLAQSRLVVLKVVGEKILFSSIACSKIEIFLWLQFKLGKIDSLELFVHLCKCFVSHVILKKAW